MCPFDSPYKSVHYCFTAHYDFVTELYNPQKTEYYAINMIIYALTGILNFGNKDGVAKSMSR